MNHRRSGAPSFEPSRAFYVGLNKVSDALVAGKHTIPDHTYSTTAKTKALGAIFPVGVAGGVAASGSLEAGVKSTAVSDPAERSQLLAVARSVFADVTEGSVAVGRGVQFEPGRDYHFAGAARFAIRTHDDFREESQLETAPRLGLWLIEIPDTLPEEHAQTVTWVVLSGTAEGQIKTELGGKVSDWRGGSQTEHLFELLRAKMSGNEREDRDDRWLEDPYFALAARNLLSASREQKIEVLFMGLEVHDCPTSGDDAEVSYLGWGPASTDREVVVSRVVLGTPYFVQFAQTTPLGEGVEDRGLWQRFKEFFDL